VLGKRYGFGSLSIGTDAVGSTPSIIPLGQSFWSQNISWFQGTHTLNQFLWLFDDTRPAELNQYWKCCGSNPCSISLFRGCFFEYSSKYWYL